MDIQLRWAMVAEIMYPGYEKVRVYKEKDFFIRDTNFVVVGKGLSYYAEKYITTPKQDTYIHINNRKLKVIGYYLGIMFAYDQELDPYDPHIYYKRKNNGQ